MGLTSYFSRNRPQNSGRLTLFNGHVAIKMLIKKEAVQGHRRLNSENLK